MISSLLLLSTILTVATTQGASPMKIIAFQTEDVKIITYPSPEFSNDLSVLLGKHTLNLDDPLIADILPYAVFVENRSAHSLFGVTARYDFQTPAGVQAHCSLFRINQNSDHSERNLAPNDNTLFTPIPRLNTLLRDFGGPENWPPEARRYVGGKAAAFLRNTETVFSIDSVIDDKGLIVGPDREATLLRVNTTNDAEQDLIKKTQVTLATLGMQSALDDLKIVAVSDRDKGTVDSKRGVNKQLLFYQTAQSRLANAILSASGSGIDVTAMLNSWASRTRLHISRKAETSD